MESHSNSGLGGHAVTSKVSLDNEIINFILLQRNSNCYLNRKEVWVFSNHVITFFHVILEIKAKQTYPVRGLDKNIKKSKNRYGGLFLV